MISLGIAAAIGAAIGAVALGAASAATHGDVPGLAIALQHIPPTTHGYEVVTAVKNALAGGTPRFSMTAQPASVVPFGVATIRNSCIGSRPSIKRSSAVPFIVWRASLYATSRGNPDRTPPSIIE